MIHWKALRFGMEKMLLWPYEVLTTPCVLGLELCRIVALPQTTLL